jgi:cytochrome oxidase Cu insertion factor (SCO1/SenC/PrrC family)
MKLQSVVRKNYISIFFFIILLVMILGGLMEKTYALEDTDIAELMKSMNMNMYALSEPLEAPNFKLHNIDGDTIELNQLRGNVVLLSFWATW